MAKSSLNTNLQHFDAIIIGTGQAGPPLAKSMANHDYKVAIIEKGDFGGTCVNVGCTPTKAYVASARRAYVTKNSAEHGVEITGDIKINLKTIKSRKDKIVEEHRQGLKSMLENDKNITVFKDIATFRDAHTIECGPNLLSADKIYINVGGRPRIPTDFENVDYLTNETILDLEKAPEHIIIVGGGYIGLEFGQMFRRFGSRVTILDSNDQLLKKEDDEIATQIAEIFKNEDIEIRLNSKCISAKNSGEEIEVSVSCENDLPTIKGSHLLLATGRIPNTDNLGLENAGIEINDRGYINVNQELQTNISHIYALGDCNGHGGFTHTAYNDFQIVESHLFKDKKRYLSDRYLCYAAFIDPAVARVGLNEKDIRKLGIKAKMASIPMKNVSRAQEMGETAGVMRVFIEEGSDKILGATFLGAGADEYIHSIIDIMYANVPYTVIRDAVHIHPTISELIPTLLEDPKEL